ncbi:2-vinyl bacteriochlorophyllide hydratase [Oscillochloris sp. ZM17-4]|uniref:2-vinyl bacteriochlorophyllide hydratase n=1 Tax=Oscillochloris sp. ZM17-4 TaxID=2866714 RepID=UPI001C736544|nr:2-vinyl bacteriochlorophyllide hydratase [Oscillochloris sp. ZM17-4]MBX0326166.1 2-vinyl bacteriochlorophyllide hydratase [Oscillochloris sp. ZM17-4]
MYTPDQLARRERSKWTRVQIILAPIQFVAFLISFGLVIHYLVTGQGYLAATISIWVKIALIWALTITGMLWEYDMYDHYFMAKEFFWEDLGNLIAILTHNAYFVAKWVGADERTVMWVMVFAYITYLFNAAQFIVRGIRSARQRRALQSAGTQATTVRS